MQKKRLGIFPNLGKENVRIALPEFVQLCKDWGLEPVLPEEVAQQYGVSSYNKSEPQTLKTLEAYARLEAQGIETESIRMAKGRISGVLDKLCDGYEKQLDKLFETDAMDISADIAVMERMLKKDGLTDDDFVFKTEQK